MHNIRRFGYPDANMKLFFNRKKSPNEPTRIPLNTQVVSHSRSIPLQKSQKLPVSTSLQDAEASEKLRGSIVRRSGSVKRDAVSKLMQNKLTTFCPCCGSVVHYPDNINKLKCGVCMVATVFTSSRPTTPHTHSFISLSELNSLVKKCHEELNLLRVSDSPTISKSEVFEPVTKYIVSRFNNPESINNSFRNTANDKVLINYDDVTEFYNILLSLPTRKPFCELMNNCINILKKPGSFYAIDPELLRKRDSKPSYKAVYPKFVWLLIIWEIPLIKQSFADQNVGLPNSTFITNEMLSMAYEISKYVTGYLATIPFVHPTNTIFLVNHLRYLEKNLLQNFIQISSLYLTFQLKKIINDVNGRESKKEKLRSLKSRSLPTTPSPTNSNQNISPLISNNENSIESNNIRTNPFSNINDNNQLAYNLTRTDSRNGKKRLSKIKETSSNNINNTIHENSPYGHQPAKSTSSLVKSTHTIENLSLKRTSSQPHHKSNNPFAQNPNTSNNNLIPKVPTNRPLRSKTINSGTSHVNNISSPIRQRPNLTINVKTQKNNTNRYSTNTFPSNQQRNSISGFPSIQQQQTQSPVRSNPTTPIIKPQLRNNLLQDFKFKTTDYDGDWQIRCICRFLSLLNYANSKRTKTRLESNVFYNVLLDFIDYKKDFTNWQNIDKYQYNSNWNKLQPWENLQDFNSIAMQFLTTPKTFFCHFAFLLSIGIKISIMEYEVHNIMEYEAEQAFLSSLDKGKAVSVYFKIKVHRDSVAKDSLHQIRKHKRDLLKSLRVVFIGEPGIDAGGLRKEWFFLLTKTVFNPLNSLFVYVEESRLEWFSIQMNKENSVSSLSKKNEELYYLFGLVLGLAIFNSNILDLKFPKAFYKKLCDESLTFDDFSEIYPQTASNLMKMLEYNEDDFESLFCLNFETTFIDQVATIKNNKKSNDSKTLKPVYMTAELCENGSNIPVTQMNKHRYVTLWMDFYLNRSISEPFNKFEAGFKHVFAQCMSSKLFNSEELEKLICGSIQHDSYDFSMLRSVTKYTNGFTDESQVVTWFWDIIKAWPIKLQKRLLIFVSGSDRIPTTGIASLPFKLTRIESGGNPQNLPLAHTCFNELCLWEYESKDILERKLEYAIMEAEGFGFK